jgi:pyruvate dehydrogenase E2 component (dihydrolipoamide acetyltransferase)
MTDIKQFRLPDVGEGLTEADIVSWHVKPGDKVAINQVIVEIETAKAVVELPCPFEGVVTQLLVDEGQTVDVGTPIIAVETSGGATAGQISDDPERGRGDSGPPEGGQPAGERQAVLVGYGVKPGATTRRARRTPATAAAAQTPASLSAPPAPPASTTPATPGASSALAATRAPAALAKPPVRKLARDLGVDLSELSGTGPQGSITRDDIQQAARETSSRSGSEIFAGPAGAGRAAVQMAPGRADGRREERIPVRGVRKRVAEAMVASAFTAPHVTEFLDVDVTETMDALRRLRELPEFAELRVSPLLFVARALLVAVARHPMINSTWDSGAQEIIVRNYVNLGFAAATERGLIVPNIKDAHALSLPALAAAFAGLTATARDGRCSPADLTGGTITITNVGVFGVDAGTPILTPGEAAILAFGRIRDAPWARDGQVVVRKVTTLSLSFDHRIVDGELGSAVLRDIGQMLEDPIRMLAWA